MKVVMIKNQIINCEEIRNIVSFCGGMRIFFKNSANNSCTDIETDSLKEKNEILNMIYDEMISQ